MNDDVLIITKNDLYKSTLNKEKCNGYTLKGKSCKNKIYNHTKYCKIHHNKFRLEKPDDCPICMESLNNVILPLSCSHWIHRKCILNWGKDKCPICRQNITLTSNEKMKLYKLNHKKSSNDIDIEIPQEVIEYFYSIIINEIFINEDE